MKDWNTNLDEIPLDDKGWSPNILITIQYIKEKDSRMVVSAYMKQHQLYTTSEDRPVPEMFNVLAWMPYPKTYRK